MGGENMIGWYHKEHHIIIFPKPFDFKIDMCFFGTIFE